MIISASRRTDIPALYSQWFMNRARAGWCLVPNPFNSKQVSYISLKPEDADAVIFWSKNPAPMLQCLDELDAIGMRYCFQFTLNDYPSLLEPNMPALRDRIDTFLQLGRRLGPLRVIWRYDPIIISNITTFEFHCERFAALAEELREATQRVIVSVVDFYRKTDRRLSTLEKEGFTFQREAALSPLVADLIGSLADIARRQGMEVFSCAEPRDFSDFGAPPGRCIDDVLLKRIWPILGRFTKDPSQRKECLCVASKDIGMNDTCIHGCPYCYSTNSYELAKRRYKEHDPSSPAIWGHPDMPPERSGRDAQIGLFG
jgi:hypothetical protein